MTEKKRGDRKRIFALKIKIKKNNWWYTHFLLVKYFQKLKLSISGYFSSHDTKRKNYLTVELWRKMSEMVFIKWSCVGRNRSENNTGSVENLRFPVSYFLSWIPLSFPSHIFLSRPDFFFVSLFHIFPAFSRFLQFLHLIWLPFVSSQPIWSEFWLFRKVKQDLEKRKLSSKWGPIYIDVHISLPIYSLIAFL